MPRVSVILTSFNHEKYIREAIDSVLAQTFTDFELIIWDDASRDGSWEIIEGYADERIRKFRNDASRRAIHGLNKVIREVAAGEYIAIHHSDDAWEPEKLEKQVAFLDSHPEFGAVFTNTLAIGEDSQQLDDPEHFYTSIFDQPNRTRQEWLNHFFNRGNALCHPSVLIRRQCYDECGLYRYGLAQFTDFDMWIRLCLKYEIHVLSEPLVRFRVREDEANTSGNRPEVRIRCAAEYNPILRNFLSLQSVEALLEILPEAGKYVVDPRHHASCRFMLAMLMVENDRPTYYKQLGTEILFELLNDKQEAETIKAAHGFDYLDLVRITGSTDIFNIEEVRTLNYQLAEEQRKMAELLHRIAELETGNGELLRRIAELETGNGELLRRIAELETGNGELLHKIAELETGNGELLRRNDELEKGLGELHLTVVQLHNSIHYRVGYYLFHPWEVPGKLLKRLMHAGKK